MNIDCKYSFYPTDESLSWTLADSELEFKKNLFILSSLVLGLGILGIYLSL